jgi:hypothetical protein
MSPVSARRAWAVALLAALALPDRASAYFDDTRVGARALSLGAAAGATTSDATSYHWNPAGLAFLGRPEVMADYARPFGLPDLDVGTLAVAARRWGVGWALAWNHLGVEDTYSEDLFSLAAGRVLHHGRSGHALAAGATYKFGRAAFQPITDTRTGETADYGSQSKGSLDLGLRWVTPWSVDFAWVARDVVEPRYEFVPGSGGGLRPLRQELSAALRWNRESTITTGISEIGSGEASYDIGLEILFFDVFAIRSGLSNTTVIWESGESPEKFQFTGGFGVFHKGYYVDASAVTNRDLGASYRVTLRVPVGAAPGTEP